MKTALVSGGAGFIGSHFVRRLLAGNPTVRIVNLDSLTYAGSTLNLEELPDPGRHTFVQGDVRDRPLVDQLLRQHAVDTIVHFAAESHVDRSILAPIPFVETNVAGTVNLLEAARHFWVEGKVRARGGARFLHISTDEVYGDLGPQESPCSEDRRYEPNSPYAASKAAADHFVRAYAQTYGLPVLISNCTNNYGPHQFPEKLIPLMILNGMQGKPLPLYGDGLQVRDWLYVEDHCQALIGLLERGRAGQTYNIAAGTQLTNLQVVRRLCAILDDLLPDSPHVPHSSLIQFVADRPGHDRRYDLDASKLRTELGWQPAHGLDDGLRKTVSWYLSHPKWVEAVRSRPAYHAWLEANYVGRGERKQA